MKNAKKKLAKMGYKVRTYKSRCDHSSLIVCAVEFKNEYASWVEPSRSMGRIIKNLARHHCGWMNP